MVLLRTYIVTFNLYKHPNKRLDTQVHHQRISTRIFLLLLTVSSIVLLFYVSLNNVRHTETVTNPSLNQINVLYQQYSDGLRCPCHTLSVEYQMFIKFDPQFHSICASDFVRSKTWLEMNYPSWKFDTIAIPLFRTNIDDFRQISSSLFQLLTSFCQLSIQILNTELLAFNHTTFITPSFVSQQQFHVWTSQIISQFTTNTARSFISALGLINNMTSANMLLSALSSDSVLTANPQYYSDLYSKDSGYDYHYEYVYDQRDQHYNSTLTGTNCDCQVRPQCIQPAVVYDLDATTVLFPVPGKLYIHDRGLHSFCLLCLIHVT